MEKLLTALLFDVDGTLADTEEVHRESFNTAFAEAGLDWHWSQALYSELLAVTGGKERIRYFLEQHPQEFEFDGDLFAYIAKLHARKTEIYTKALAEGQLPLRPGIERLLKEAHTRDMRLAIVTTTTLANVAALLEHSFSEDVSSWFEVIAAGNIVPHKKPAPDIYEYTLEKMQIDPGECLAIEDSVNGLASARRANVRSLITVNPYTEDHDFTGAALVLDHLGELDMPCKMIEGELAPDGMVDVPFLQRLHASSS